MRTLTFLMLLLLAGCGSSSQSVNGSASSFSPASAQTDPSGRVQEVHLGGEIAGHPGERLNLDLTIEDGVEIEGHAVIDAGANLRPYHVQGQFLPGGSDTRPLAMLELYPWDQADTESMTVSGSLQPGGRLILSETGAESDVYGTVNLSSPVVAKEGSVAAAAELGKFRLRFIESGRTDPESLELDVTLTERSAVGISVFGTWTTAKPPSFSKYIGTDDHGTLVLSYSQAGLASIELRGLGLDHRDRKTQLTYAMLYVRFEGPAPIAQVVLAKESWFSLKRTITSGTGTFTNTEERVVTVLADPSRSLLLPLK